MDTIFTIQRRAVQRKKNTIEAFLPFNKKESSIEAFDGAS